MEDRAPRGGSTKVIRVSGAPTSTLSLAENGTVLPQLRLVTDGDVKGGRYVSGVVDFYVGSGPAY